MVAETLAEQQRLQQGEIEFVVLNAMATILTSFEKLKRTIGESCAPISSI